MNPVAPHLIDLTRYAWRREARGFVLYGTWLFRSAIGVPPEPCLVITPNRQVSHERTTPAVIPIRASWIWSEEYGDPRHCARSSAAFLENMDMTASPLACMSLTMAIRDHLGDLLHIPPWTGERVVVADAIRTDASGRQHHAEITERA